MLGFFRNKRLRDLHRRARRGQLLESYRQDIADQAMQAQQIFESFMQEHHVPRATGATVSLSFGWLDDAPEGDDFVGSYGRVWLLCTEAFILSAAQQSWRRAAILGAEQQSWVQSSNARAM
jgi:hypothetical protein